MRYNEDPNSVLTIGLEINRDFRNITELYKTDFMLDFDGNGGKKKKYSTIILKLKTK